MNTHVVFLFFSMLLLTNNHAQITISNANPYNSSNHLINNVLLGGGVSASNVTYQGDPIQVGFFNAINSNLGIDSGIVLSTGDIIDLDPSGFGSGNIPFSTNSDPDLLNVANSVPLINQPFNVSGIFDVAP